VDRQFHRWPYGVGRHLVVAAADAILVGEAEDILPGCKLPVIDTVAPANVTLSMSDTNRIGSIALAAWFSV